MKENNLVDNDDFKVSRGWLEKFLKLIGLSLEKKTSVAQQDPDRMVAKLVSYVFQVRRLQEITSTRLLTLLQWMKPQFGAICYQRQPLTQLGRNPSL